MLLRQRSAQRHQRVYQSGIGPGNQAETQRLAVHARRYQRHYAHQRPQLRLGHSDGGVEPPVAPIPVQERIQRQVVPLYHLLLCMRQLFLALFQIVIGHNNYKITDFCRKQTAETVKNPLFIFLCLSYPIF